MYLRFSGFFWVPLGPRKFPARPTGFMCMSVDSSPVQVLASFSTFLQTPPGSYGFFRKDPFGFYFLLLLRKSSSFLRKCFDTPGVSSRFPSHSLGFAQNLVGYLGPSGFFLPLLFTPACVITITRVPRITPGLLPLHTIPYSLTAWATCFLRVSKRSRCVLRRYRGRPPAQDGLKTNPENPRRPP